MPDAGTFRFPLLFGREIQRVTQKNICVSLVPRVAPHNGIKRFGESNFLHGMKKARLKRARKHNRQTWSRQLRRSEWSIGTLMNCVSLLQHSKYSIIPPRKSRSGLLAHRDILRAGRVALARVPAIGSPP